MSTPSTAREQALVTTFVRLADTLVADYDVIELFHGLCGDCVSLLGVDAAGLLLTDQRGNLQVVAASTEAANLRRAVPAPGRGGPVPGLLPHRRPRSHAGDLAADTRWPRFAALADENGFTAVHALPMRLREETIGALNLFHRSSTDMSVDELPSARPWPTSPPSPSSRTATPASGNASPSSSRPR